MDLIEQTMPRDVTRDHWFEDVGVTCLSDTTDGAFRFKRSTVVLIVV